jgi:hypothetical protein
MKWLKNLIKEAIKAAVDEVVEEKSLGKFNNFTLSKDNVNVLYIPVGKLPKSKADEYVHRVVKEFKKANPEYKVAWFALPS